MIAVAEASLALASAGLAAMVLGDGRRIRRIEVDQRVYRPELGWSDANQLDARRRWAWASLVTAAGLLLAPLGVASGALGAVPAAAVSILACATVVAWRARDRRLHHGRYTSVCIATLAFAVLLYQGALIVLDDPADTSAAQQRLSAPMLSGTFASVFAGQLYLVSGIRKLRSPYFMAGRVLVDNLAYATFQAAAGNRDFFKIVRPQRLPSLLCSTAFLSGCRLAAILTALVELALGLGAIGLLPVTLTFALAIPTHLTFLLVSPRRVMPFTLAALGLLALATAHPLLRIVP